MNSRQYRPQEEKFESYEQLLEAVSTKYTLSFKAACKLLKCSRAWASKNIRPYVGCVYLRNGIGTGGPNFAKIVTAEIRKRNGIDDSYSNESIWLDEQDFYRFVRKSIVSCQKRSKSLHKLNFIEKGSEEAYYIRRLLLEKQVEHRRLPSDEKMQYWKDREEMYLDYAVNDFVAEIIHPNIVYKTKRTEAEFVDVPLPEVHMNKWEAVHDLMDYGDVEETHYRRLFEEGYIRIEIKVPEDEKTKSRGRVYYIADPEPTESGTLTEQQKHKIISKVYAQCGGSKQAIEEQLNELVFWDKMNVKQGAWYEYCQKTGKKVQY